MKCEYTDGFTVDYSGSLHITEGEGVDLEVKEGRLKLDQLESMNFLRASSALLSVKANLTPKPFGIFE